MAARRDLSLEELGVVAELATMAPDLLAARDRLLAALSGATVVQPGGGRLKWEPSLQPKTWKELIEAVRLGVIPPREARRFVAVPQPEGAAARLRQAARLRWQRGGGPA